MPRTMAVHAPRVKASSHRRDAILKRGLVRTGCPGAMHHDRVGHITAGQAKGGRWRRGRHRALSTRRPRGKACQGAPAPVVSSTAGVVEVLRSRISRKRPAATISAAPQSIAGVGQSPKTSQPKTSAQTISVY